VQWYGNVPAVWNATENRPPGATVPEFHPVESEVEVWATASVLIHVTDVPTATLSSSGMKALFPSGEAPAGIATDDDVLPVVGVGVGDGDGDTESDELLPPHAIARVKTAETIPRRNENMRPSALPNQQPHSNIPAPRNGQDHVFAGISRGLIVLIDSWPGVLTKSVDRKHSSSY